MNHKRAIEAVIAWTLTLVFVFTAIITALSLPGLVKIVSEAQQQKLFYVLILELVAVCLGYFKGFLKFRPFPSTKEDNGNGSAESGHLTPKGSKSVPSPDNKFPTPSGQASRREIHEVMLEAKKKLVISGHTLDKFTRRDGGGEMRQALQTLFNRNVEVTCILVHPDSPYVEAHEHFHELETMGPEKSAKNQIMATINFFEHGCRLYPENFAVYLSDYKPGFRTIIIDDVRCHVDLYMFAKDVDVNPSQIYDEKCEEFQVVRDSVTKLLEYGTFVTPLVKDGSFNSDWRNHAASHFLRSCLEQGRCPYQCKRWRKVKSVLLADQNGSATQDYGAIPDVCDEDYMPGTFTVSDIDKASSYFLDKKRTYQEWLEQAVRNELDAIKASRNGEGFKGGGELTEIKNFVEKTLEFRPSQFLPLKHQVWFQENTDIIRRIILTRIAGNADKNLPQQERLTQRARSVVEGSLKALNNDKEVDLARWLRITIAAGVVGLEHKPDYAATSIVLREAAIKLPSNSEGSDSERAGEELARNLLDEIPQKSACDDVDLFFKKLKIIEETKGEVQLVAFPDDYIETMYLMHYYGKLLDQYRQVRLTIVPRSLYCGNDATYSDIETFIKANSTLRTAYGAQHPRLKLLSTGPKMGAVNLRKLHPEVIIAIQKADLLDVRGARNYETMQRVRKDAFFGFMIARTTSEAVTGFKGKYGRFYYKFQEAGSCSFCDKAQDEIKKMYPHGVKTKQKAYMSDAERAERGACPPECGSEQGDAR